MSGGNATKIDGRACPTNDNDHDDSDNIRINHQLIREIYEHMSVETDDEDDNSACMDENIIVRGRCVLNHHLTKYSNCDSNHLIVPMGETIISGGSSDLDNGSISGRNTDSVVYKSGYDSLSTEVKSGGKKRSKNNNSSSKKAKNTKRKKMVRNCCWNISKRTYMTIMRNRMIKRIQYCIMQNIKTDLKLFMQHGSNNAVKYDPVPILVLSNLMIASYINFENCIILQNPKFDGPLSRNVCYDPVPKHIGNNLKKDKLFFMQYGVGVKLYKVKDSRVAILCPLSEFELIMRNQQMQFLKIIVPDIKLDKKESVPEFEEKYDLLMLSKTEKANNLPMNLKFNKKFVNLLETNMRVNMKGTNGHQKHHGCLGKYFGYGLISKYAMKDNLSISDFAGNDPNNPKVTTIISQLIRTTNDLFKRYNSVLPMAVYCGFSLVSALISVAALHNGKCHNLNKLIQKYKSDEMNFVPISNWICKNAETLVFHQEYDSSYTMISTPYWEKNDVCTDTNKQTQQGSSGTANFVFKWTTSDPNNREHRYFPVMMSEGVSIFFSGYGCYHRKHRTNNEDFWNFASYQNRSFYHKMRMSVIRCLLDE